MGGFCWLFFLGALLQLASSQVMITVKPSRDVKDNDFVFITCSYPIKAIALPGYSLAVNGIRGPIPLPSPINSSDFYTIMSILEANFTVRSLAPTVVVEFSFNARREYDGYNLTCVLTANDQANEVSTVVTLHVRRGPCCNGTAKPVSVICPLSDHFMLNASDIVEDAGSPQVVVIWMYGNEWSAATVGDLHQSLRVNIPSVASREGLIQASAMNEYGKTALDFDVLVRAIRVPLENLQCDVNATAVACRWSPIIGSGEAKVPGYRVLLSNSNDDIIGNETTENPNRTFRTGDTSFSDNAVYTVEVRARNGMCEGPGERYDFTAPGAPSEPTHFKCLASSPSQVSLTWASPTYSHPDLPLEGFTVSYFVVSFLIEMKLNSSELQLEVDGLHPNTTYYFNVTTENDFGHSSAALAICTTPPPGTPTAVVLDQVEPIPGGVRLSWTASVPGMTGVYIRSYNVTYQCGCGNEISKDVGNVTTTELSGLGVNMRCTFTVISANTINRTSPTTEASTKDATTGAFSTSTEQSGSVQSGAIAGIAVGCFIVGCLVGIVGTAVTVHWSWCWKHAKTEECRSREEQVTDSSAYELPARMQSQATYADVLAAEEQETSSRLTANPAYATN